MSKYKYIIKIQKQKRTYKEPQKPLLKFFLSLSIFSLLLSFFSFSVLFYKKEREREKRK